jgi:hypothetical protein
MANFLKRHEQNALLAALIGAAAAILIGIVSIVLTVYFNNETQDRQLRLEQVSKFDASSQQVIDAGASFIAAINNNRGLAPAREKLSAVVAAQIHETDKITKFFDDRVQQRAGRYENALSELNEVAQRTSSAADMRTWTETFGRVLDANSTLSRALYYNMGIKGTSS